MKTTFAMIALTAALSLSAAPAAARDSHAQWSDLQSFSQPIFRSGSNAHSARRPGSFTGPGQTNQTALLLPAVQSAREAARRNQQSSAPGGLPRGFARQSNSRTPIILGQDGNDLLIVNNGDGSDF